MATPQEADRKIKQNSIELTRRKIERLRDPKRNAAYMIARNEFSKRFNEHMFGDVQEFSEVYSTLVELVIIPAIEDALLSNPLNKPQSEAT